MKARPSRAHATLFLSLVLSAGCSIDEPVCVSRTGAGPPAQWLSELHLFTGSGAGLTPAADVIPYDVKVPLYADDEGKHRFVVLPPGARLGATADRWDIPEGTLLLKTFTVPLDQRDPGRGERLIETRILQRTATGYRAGTYAWNEEQTDAACSGGNLEVEVAWTNARGQSRTQFFHVAGTSQCPTCHARAPDDQARDALGWRTRQLDVGPGGGGGQIEHFAALGLLAGPAPAAAGPPLEDPFGSAPLAARARSYLDVNCGACHSPHGLAKGKGLDFTLEGQGARALGFCRSAGSVDGRDQVIVPGHPERSVMLARMRSDNPFERMPRSPNQTIDAAGADLVAAWVASLDPSVCR